MFNSNQINADLTTTTKVASINLGKFGVSIIDLNKAAAKKKQITEMNALFIKFKNFKDIEKVKLSNPVFKLGFQQIEKFHAEVLNLIKNDSEEEGLDGLINVLHSLADHLYDPVKHASKKYVSPENFFLRLRNGILSNPYLTLVMEKMQNNAPLIWVNLLIMSPELIGCFYNNFVNWRLWAVDFVKCIEFSLMHITNTDYSNPTPGYDNSILYIYQISLLQSVILLPDIYSTGNNSFGRFLYLNRFKMQKIQLSNKSTHFYNNYFISYFVWYFGYLENVNVNPELAFLDSVLQKVIQKAIIIYGIDNRLFNIISLHFTKEQMCNFMELGEKSVYWRSLAKYTDCLGKPIYPNNNYLAKFFNVDKFFRAQNRT